MQFLFLVEAPIRVSSSYIFLRTWMMLTELFLSSGPIHCSISTPSFSAPLIFPNSVSSANGGGCQSVTATGHPPKNASTSLNGSSPMRRSCSVNTLFSVYVVTLYWMSVKFTHGHPCRSYRKFSLLLWPHCPLCLWAPRGILKVVFVFVFKILTRILLQINR